MKVKEEPVVPFAEFENYLLEQLSKGEVLFKKGPEYYEAAAIELFRAIINCPNPIQLVFMLESMIPKP
ncbi:mitochondrial import receptor subunit tom20, partial [Massospora cicadina]